MFNWFKRKKIVVRIPPSPTGFFHVGRARTALFNYLFAKQQGGKIIFRVEDTDKERSKKEFEEDIIESLRWLGITYDEGPIRQSERGAVYSKYIKKMLDNGTAYVSKETEGANSEVIRFKNPSKKVTFTDLIRGDITVDTTDLENFVIARNVEDPLYHLTVVVDDFEMGITHVIRGDDGIANTPRQILIQEAIGAPRPLYAHVPLILAPDKSKMSARHGATSLRDFREAGYLPEAFTNFLALLGFNPGGERELYSLHELTKVFTIEKVQKGGAVFNTEKLDWFNKEYLKKLSPKEIEQNVLREINNTKFGNSPKLNDEKFLAKITPIVFDRISKWGDVRTVIEAGELDFAFEAPQYDPTLLSWKGSSLDEVKTHLSWVKDALTPLQENTFTSVESIKSVIFDYATEKGRGTVLWPLRVALSGKEKSPDPFTLLHILGKEESLKRIETALSKA